MQLKGSCYKAVFEEEVRETAQGQSLEFMILQPAIRMPISCMCKADRLQLAVLLLGPDALPSLQHSGAFMERAGDFLCLEAGSAPPRSQEDDSDV